MTEEKVKFTEGGERLIISKTEDSEHVKKIYEAYEKLEALGEKAGENKLAYKTILKGTKQTENCKIIAAPFIAKFFKYFDDLQSEAIDAYLDLAEEDSIKIRLAAIKGVSQICRDKPSYVLQISNVLGQLLPDEEVEADVTEALLNLLEINTIATVEALCQLVTNQEDKELISKVIGFLRSKIVYGGKKDLVTQNAEVEKLLIEKLKPLLSKIEGDDFSNVLFILRKLPHFQKEEGSKELLSLLLDNSSVDVKKFDATHEDSVQKLLNFVPLVVQLAKAGADYGDVWRALVSKILPNSKNFELEITLRIYQSLADLSSVVVREDAKSAIGSIYQIIQDLLPIPAEGEEPEYNFSFLEPLLVAFHNCGYKAPGSLNPVCGIKIFTGQPDEDTGDYSSKREDMIKRITLFLNKTQEYHKRYSEQKLEDPGKDASEEEKEQFIFEKKQASMRNRLLSNLKKLTRPLLGTSPSTIPAFNAISVSWRPPRKNKNQAIKRKRGPQEGGSKPSKFQRGNTGARGRGRGGRGGRGHRGGNRGRR